MCAGLALFITHVAIVQLLCSSCVIRSAVEIVDAPDQTLKPQGSFRYGAGEGDAFSRLGVVWQVEHFLGNRLAAALQLCVRCFAVAFQL